MSSVPIGASTNGFVTHRDQVETNVQVKLKPRTDRKERSALSQDQAIEDASRLALAALLTRKLTLRYSAEAEAIHVEESALDVPKILHARSSDDRTTLLERPLFAFASYGRVQFHHRSVLEYLAAKRLESLLLSGRSIKAIKRLLFTETAHGLRTIRPTMRPVAAWLSLSQEAIFKELVATDPAVLLDYGDPQSLTTSQRTKALEAYVNQHGRGGWRGLSHTAIQVSRFASPELDAPVQRLWHLGIENYEVRELLLELIGFGKLETCADIVYQVATDKTQPVRERKLAIDALVQLDDPRLTEIATSLASDPFLWSAGIATYTALSLMPAYLTASQLISLLERTKDEGPTISDINYFLPEKIATAPFTADYLHGVRQGLTDLIVDGAEWNPNDFSHPTTKRSDLLPALIATCHRQWLSGVRSEAWLISSTLALRFSHDRYDSDDRRKILPTLSPLSRESNGKWDSGGRTHFSKGFIQTETLGIVCTRFQRAVSV